MIRDRVSLRGAVGVLFAISMVYAAGFAEPISRTLVSIVSIAAGNREIATAWALGAVLILGGHVVRAYRDTILFSKAAATSVRSQFGAFSVGTLCSAVLPFKLGEFIRADVIAQRYKISYSFTFVLVCIERLADAAVLLALALLFVGFYVPLAVICVALALFVWVLWASPRWFKGLLSFVGGSLNDRLEARLLFVFWSLEYGLRRTLSLRVMLPYAALTIVNWGVYVAAFVPVVACFGGGGAFESVSASAGAFVALTTALTPAALGSYTATLASFGLADPAAYIMLWMAAMVPIAFIGLLFACFRLRKLPLLRPRVVGRQMDAANKLSRSADISSDQLGYLKDYYSGKRLARKVSLDEMEGGGPAVNRFLTGGGSGAVTFLSEYGGGECVTKLVAKEKSQALKEQYDWLRAHEGPMVVRAYQERCDDEAYSIDIEFERESVDCYERIHSCSSAQRKELMGAVVEMLAADVWRAPDGVSALAPDEARRRVDDYLERHVERSLALAAEAMPGLSDVMAAEQLVINGEPCANIAALLRVVRDNAEIMADLCSFRESPSIHGDLILDNIIWSSEKGCPVVLDPVPCGNCFDGPVFDFGKLSQSLQIGYEFLLRDLSPVEARRADDGVVRIDYADRRSAAYDELWRYVRDDLAPRYLSDSEMRTMLFIGATNYLRRMKHQAVQCPENALKFYGAGILYWNRYVRLFQ